MTATERLRELVELNRSIISTLDFDDVLERVVEKTASFTSADACALLLVGDDGLARVAASRGLDEEIAREFAAELDERINVALMGLLDFHPEDEFVGVPVIDHGVVRGLLAVYRRGPQPPLEPESEEHYLVSALADQAAIALDHAVRYRAVSEEKERHFRLLQAIQSNTSTYLAYLDTELRFVEANVGFCRALGHAAADLAGRRYEDLENAPPILPLLLAVRAGEKADEAQVRVRLRDSARGGLVPGERPAYWKVSVRPVQGAEGGVEGLVISASDVTDEVMARKDIERANRRKDEFLAMLGHELRNPVAAIATAAEVMRLGNSGAPVATEVRDVVYRQVRHMARLLDDLLDVSRITRGSIELRKTRVDLRDVAAHALQSVRQSVESRRQQLRVDLPEHPVLLLADVDRLVQVVSNLLANASRYTPPGGHVELSIRARPGFATIAVRDDGDGIDPEDLPFLFEPFTQSKRGLDRPGGGLGLGLALVKQLAELHGGTVAASSAGRGLGSVFEVELPLPPLDATETPVRKDPGAREQPRRRILVVEDNVDFAHNLAVLLQGEGHQVETVADGPRAIDAVARSAPDLVLLDIGLPGMDGFELARRIRRLDGPAPILVAVSGYGDRENRKRARESGIDHYLVKPFLREKLWQLLDAG